MGTILLSFLKTGMIFADNQSCCGRVYCALMTEKNDL